ncbi:MAG: hypothetical protein ACLQIQ_07195 [Beijerinckiaceae bacterium]
MITGQSSIGTKIEMNNPSVQKSPTVINIFGLEPKTTRAINMNIVAELTTDIAVSASIRQNTLAFVFFLRFTKIPRRDKQFGILRDDF